jgi:hypothetical protein
MAEYHALSRNMMHSNIAITDQIYVHVDEKERGQILSRLHQNTVGEFDNEFSDSSKTSERRRTALRSWPRG